MRPRAAILALIAISCGAPANTGDVAGTWVMLIGGGVDTLNLDSTGTYTRAFVGESTPGGAVDTGRWRLTGNGTTVSLQNLPNRWPDHGRYDPKLGWHMPDTSIRRSIALTINRTWTGKTRLDLIPEQGWRYSRPDLK